MRTAILKRHHLEHLADLGYANFPLRIRYDQAEFDAAWEAWRNSGIDDPQLLEAKALGHIYHRQQQQKDISLTERHELHGHLRSVGLWVKSSLVAIGLLLAVLIFLSLDAHCQFSHVTTVSATDGTHTVFTAGPYSISFTGCTVGGTGAAWTISCASGGTNNPGGSPHQIQTNGGTVFNGISNGTAGQVLCSNGASLDPSMCDPIVSGPDAPGVAPTKNPVQIGLFDGTNVQRAKSDTSGNAEVVFPSAQHVIVDTAPTTPVTGTFFQATQPVSTADGAQATLGAKADAKNAATDTTAVSAISLLKELSSLLQGTITITPSGTVTVSGTVTANQGGTWTVQPGNTANTTAWKVDGSAVTQPVSISGNQAVNVAQVAGASTSATNPLYTRETDGSNAVVLDPCRTQANIFKPISQTANTQLVTGTSAKKIYVCSINLVTAGANNVAMVEGTGSTCGTGTAGMAGGSTAATGWNFAANGGLTQGNGMGSIMAEATNADNLCLLQSAAVQLSGVIGYVVQ